MTTCDRSPDVRPPTSAAYYHPRRDRPLRVGDRVRIIAPDLRFSPEIGARNYPGAGNYGTVTAIGSTFVKIMTDDLDPTYEEPGSYYPSDFERI